MNSTQINTCQEFLTASYCQLEAFEFIEPSSPDLNSNPIPNVINYINEKKTRKRKGSVVLQTQKQIGDSCSVLFLCCHNHLKHSSSFDELLKKQLAMTRIQFEDYLFYSTFMQRYPKVYFCGYDFQAVKSITRQMYLYFETEESINNTNDYLRPEYWMECGYDSSNTLTEMMGRFSV
jgi:hypothetical protein